MPWGVYLELKLGNRAAVRKGGKGKGYGSEIYVGETD